MSQKPETVFRARVRKKLDALPRSWWESVQQKTIRGTPDVLGCLAGFFVALEFKASTSSKVEVLQEYKLSKIAEAGGMGLVVHPDNWDETYELLVALSKGD